MPASFHLRACAAALAIPAAGFPAAAQECCEAGSPFMPGEAYAETPATCETIGDWIERAPDTGGRVTMSIRGEIVDAQWDGTLAYLLMCEEPGVQVLCVTYSIEGRAVGDTVLFGGGYSRVGERQIMLDPCLATVEE